MARERACILCGACADVCPTGALKPFEATREGWALSVDMGLARVNEAMCYSFKRAHVRRLLPRLSAGG